MSLPWTTGAGGLASVPIAEVKGSPLERIEGLPSLTPSASATAILRVAWDDRIDVLDDIVSNHVKYPHINDDRFRAISGSSEPWLGPCTVDAPQKAQYTHAKLTINYGFLEYLDTDVYTETLEPNLETVTLDYLVFRWATTGRKLRPDEAPPFFIYGFDYNVHWMNVLVIPANTWTYAGKSNNGSITSQNLGFTFPTDTLLYTPPTIEKSVNLSGGVKYSLRIKMQYRPQGWNVFYDSQTGQFDAIEFIDGGTTYTPYPQVDLSSVLPTLYVP